jgi:hypothetical protein
VTDLALYREAAQAVLASGLVSSPTASYALAEAGRAHADLEAGVHAGTAVLIP